MFPGYRAFKIDTMLPVSSWKGTGNWLPAVQTFVGMTNKRSRDKLASVVIKAARSNIIVINFIDPITRNRIYNVIHAV